MGAIVNVNVSQQLASVPSTLQQTGCICVSNGATTLTPGIPFFLTQASDLTPILSGTPSSQQTTLIAQVDTFFAQSATASAFAGGTALSVGGSGVYVMELGSSTPLAVLEAYIANPQPASNTGSPTPVPFYAYLMGNDFDQNSSFITFARSLTSPAALVYFYLTTTIPTGSPPAGGWISYEGIKSIFTAIQSPAAPVTEASVAAMFYQALNYAPSSINLASPFEYTFLYGVTPYNTLTVTNQIAAGNAAVNWVGTGAAGGISSVLIETGEFMDGNPFNYWYAIDWLIIQETQALAAAIINGSNTPLNPLYYNQAGINTLQKVAQAVVNRGISFGLILGPATVTAVPFATYVEQNPNDYAQGVYKGLAVTFTPARGFASITINLTATNIPT